MELKVNTQNNNNKKINTNNNYDNDNNNVIILISDNFDDTDGNSTAHKYNQCDKAPGVCLTAARASSPNAEQRASAAPLFARSRSRSSCVLRSAALSFSTCFAFGGISCTGWVMQNKSTVIKKA